MIQYFSWIKRGGGPEVGGGGCEGGRGGGYRQLLQTVDCIVSYAAVMGCHTTLLSTKRNVG